MTMTPVGIDPHLFERQLRLEEESNEAGARKMVKSLQKAKERKALASTPVGAYLLKRLVEPVAKPLSLWIGESLAGKAGRTATAAKKLAMIEPTVAAYIGLRNCIGRAAGKNDDLWLSYLSLQIGREIEDELKFRAFAKAKPALWDACFDSTKKDTIEHRRSVLRHCFNKFEVEWEKWSRNDCVHVGTKVVEITESATGLIRVELVQRKRAKSKQAVNLSPEGHAIIEERSDLITSLSFVRYPMLCRPADWSGMYDGGYWREEERPLPFIKTLRWEGRDRLTQEHDLSRVYAAVNGIQRTAWRVNEPVLEVLQHVLEANMDVGDVPPAGDIPRPPQPANIETDKEARKKYRRQASEVISMNLRRHARRAQAVESCRIAARFADEKAIYFPHQVDFRGRIYAVSQFLNPQGPDYVKALLTFAEGKPIENHELEGLQRFSDTASGKHVPPRFRKHSPKTCT